MNKKSFYAKSGKGGKKMTEKIYPPHLDSKLPPIEIETDGYYKFTIPFEFTSFTTKMNLERIFIKISEAMSNI